MDWMTSKVYYRPINFFGYNFLDQDKQEHKDTS